MDDARQQIVESIKGNSNILVTVSTNPSVDELSAALALTIILNNMDKRASAVFSGTIPPAISFLEPDKTFESSADSLRDFIIALNKEKADHLRYKVEGEVVKIFITPYKTTLSEKDLEFSQGDYNVELVLALGVRDQDHLDKALEAHGKILHDATVVTLTAGTEKSSLGSVDWHDGDASSLSEMVVGLADNLKGNDPILDQQIATALLTGIVSATDRFSNNRTTSKAMTMAAQLMAAGANQQLIAAKLEEAHDIAPVQTTVDSGASTDVNTAKDDTNSGSELTIDRPGRTSEAKSMQSAPVEVVSEATQPTEPAKSQEEIDQQELEKQLAGLTNTPSGTMADIEKDLQRAANSEANTPPTEAPATAPAEASPVEAAPVQVADPVVPPTEQASQELSAAPTQPVEQAAEPPKILNDHGGKFSSEPDNGPKINSIQNNPNEGESTVDPFGVSATPSPAPVGVEASLGTPEGAALLASEPDIVAPVTQVSASGSAAPVMPSLSSVDVPQLPPLPPLPNDANLPPLPPPPPPPVFGQAPSGMPSGAVPGDIFGDGAGALPSQSLTPPPEPGQFRIPGQ